MKIAIWKRGKTPELKIIIGKFVKVYTGNFAKRMLKRINR